MSSILLTTCFLKNAIKKQIIEKMLRLHHNRSEFFTILFFLNLLLYVFVRKYVDLRVSRIEFFFFFQFLFQEKNDDHDFDEFFFVRSYADFVDHEFDQKFEHVSNRNNDEKKNSRLFNRKNKKTYAKEIVKQRVRIRKSDFKNRRDDKNLNFDYMIARKKNVIFEKHVLSKFENKNNENVCFFCNVYQYVEKCHRKFIDDKY